MPRNTKPTVYLAFLAALIVLGAGLLISDLSDGWSPRASQEPSPSSTSRAAKPRPSRTARPKPRPGRSVASTASAACTDLAPRTLKAYMGEDRSKLKGSWFTTDAQGLDVPASGIARQPLDGFTGTMNTGSDRSTAVCSVWTGLESPWVIQYRYTNEAGWLAVMVQGPAEGAYALPDREKP